MITLDHVCAGYGDTTVIRDISLTIKDDEILTVVGPNGAGKSTVLKAILGIAKVTHGSIKINGEDVTGGKASSLIAKGVSYLPQGSHVFPSLTVKENLELGAKEKSLDEMYEMFPSLYEKKTQPAGTLSGGQQHMVGMARCLLQAPDLLLLDEPSAGLAPRIVEDVFETIRTIHEENTGILLIEQNTTRAIRFSDRTIVLENGEIALQGGEDLLENDKIKDIYLR